MTRIAGVAARCVPGPRGLALVATVSAASACTASTAVGTEGTGNPRTPDGAVISTCAEGTVEAVASPPFATFTDLTPSIESQLPFDVHLPQGNDQPIDVVAFSGDVDRDGRTEVVVQLTPVSRGVGVGHRVFTYDPAVAGFVPAALAGVPDDALVLALADMDGDGDDDAVTGGPSPVYWNDGHGGFTAGALPDERYELLAIRIDDIDDDGWLDILGVGIDSRCDYLRAWLQDGEHSFARQPDHVVVSVPATPNAIVSFRDDAGARVVGAIGNTCYVASDTMMVRSPGPDHGGWPTFAAYDPTPADTFACASTPRALRLAAYTPMGMALGDLDDDGAVDMIVSTIFDTVLLGRGDGSYTDGSAPWHTRPARRSDVDVPMIPWGVAIVDLDRDTRPDLVTVNGLHAGSAQPQDVNRGPEYVTLMVNGGDGRLRDATEGSRIDRRGQFHELDVTDLDGDGDPDLLVGGYGELPRLYRNDVATTRHALSITLRGTTSNPLGLGARVEVQAHAGGSVQHLVMGGVQSPAMQSRAIVFAGLGNDTRAATVRVLWPSGTRQELHDVPGDGTLVVTEPPLLAVDPPGRHSPANSLAPVVVTVTPRNVDGTVRTDASVTARVLGTDVTTAVTHDGAAWHVRLTPPGTAGTSVVEVLVGGAPVPIRPRIWWD